MIQKELLLNNLNRTYPSSNTGNPRFHWFANTPTIYIRDTPQSYKLHKLHLCSKHYNGKRQHPASYTFLWGQIQGVWQHILEKIVYLREMTENELEFFIKKSNQISSKWTNYCQKWKTVHQTNNNTILIFN